MRRMGFEFRRACYETLVRKGFCRESASSRGSPRNVGKPKVEECKATPAVESNNAELRSRCLIKFVADPYYELRHIRWVGHARPVVSAGSGGA